MKRTSILLSTVLLCLILSIVRFGYDFAKDDLDPEKLVAEHLKSFGCPEALARINTRSISGITTVRFVTGGQGDRAGEAVFVSEKGKLGIIFSYKASGYRGVRGGEYFVWDGREVTVGSSSLGGFLLGHQGIIKNGLLCGTLNVSWPLLNLKESGAKIKYKKTTIDKRDLFELEYMPNKSMDDLIVKMYFDSATFCHVMTRYRLQFTNIDVLTEKFEDFRKVDGITLPYRYSLNLQGANIPVYDSRREYTPFTFTAIYTFEADKIVHNEKINPKFYRPL